MENIPKSQLAHMGSYANSHAIFIDQSTLIQHNGQKYETHFQKNLISKHFYSWLIILKGQIQSKNATQSIKCIIRGVFFFPFFVINATTWT